MESSLLFQNVERSALVQSLNVLFSRAINYALDYVKSPSYAQPLALFQEMTSFDEITYFNFTSVDRESRTYWMRFTTGYVVSRPYLWDSKIHKFCGFLAGWISYGHVIL